MAEHSVRLLRSMLRSAHGLQHVLRSVHPAASSRRLHLHVRPSARYDDDPDDW